MKSGRRTAKGEHGTKRKQEVQGKNENGKDKGEKGDTN